MKKFLFILLVLGITNSVLAVPRNILLKGEWRERTTARSLAPAQPKITLDQKTLLICFADYLENVTITIENIHGYRVYNSCITTTPGCTHIIPLTHLSGDYVIKITHSSGTLTGLFSI